MKALATFFATTLCLGAGMLLADGRPQSATGGTDGCKFVEEALADKTQIKPGMKRSEVERTFTEDGGMNFPLDTRYVWKRCSLLKVQVEYEAKSTRLESPTSPDDVVKSVSKLYAEYPIRD